MKNFYNNLGILSLTILAISMHYCQAAPKMTEKQVISLGQAYIQSVGGSQAADTFINNSSESPVTHTNPIGGVNILHVSQDQSPDNPTNQNFVSLMENHPSEYWKITQPDKMEIEVNDSTGWIMRYINFQTIGGNDGQPAGKAIPKSQAMAIALNALKATGAPLNNLKLNLIQEIQHNTIHPEVWDHEWYILWLRTFQGIPYHRMGAHVILSAETGEVIDLVMPLEMIDPQVNIENITKVQATHIAEKQLNEVNLFTTDLPFSGITKEVVPGNRFWQSGEELHHTLQTHVVWNCRFGSPQDNSEVWVDTDTGDVIGGYETGSLGSDIAKRQIPIYGHQLTHSEVKQALEKVKTFGSAAK